MKKFNELELSKDLIKFKSVTPLDNGAINYLHKKFESIGFNSKILTFGKKGEEIKNIYARYGKKGPNLCYAGHTDVVPPGNLKNWTTNPFSPKIKNGFLIGRGANDMKSSIACFISAVNSYLNKNKNFKGSISFLITGDEEGDAINGTKKVVEYLKKNKEKIDFCIVGEPTNPNRLGEMIKIGRRGSLSVRLKIYGSQGHIAYPHLSKNPITSLIKICELLKRKKLDNGTKNFQPSNLEFTSINVDNKAHNVIPSAARTQFNVRYNTLHNSSSLKKKIGLIVKKICKKNNCKFKLEYLASGDAFITKPGKFIQDIRKIIKKITGVNTIFSTTGGTSDARFLKKIAPCLEFGLVNKTMHKIDERASIKDIKKLKKIYLHIIERYFD